MYWARIPGGILTVEEVPRQDARGVDGNKEVEAKRTLAS